MMRPSLLCGLLVPALLLVLGGVAAAADDAGPQVGVWQKEFETGANVLQSSYTNNWKGGEKGSVNWTALFNMRLENQFTERTNWRNILKLAYGQTNQQERDANGQLYWKRPDKTDDIVNFESMFRWTPASRWDPFVAFNFESMFNDKTDVDGRSLFMNPLKFKLSAGISRSLIENDVHTLLVRLGAAFSSNSRKFFEQSSLTHANPTDDTSSASSTEAAGELVAEYKGAVAGGRIDVESKLTLNQPFSYSGKKVFEDNDPTTWGLPADVADYTTTLNADLETTFSANITSVISVKLFLRWIYEKYDNTVKPVVDNGDLVNAVDVNQAIRKAGQFKETLALGLTYKWGS